MRLACTLASALVLTAAIPSMAQEVASRFLELPPDELVAILEDDGAKPFDKAKACQRLGVVGDDSAVPALAALLPDETLNAYARGALENIGSAAADKVLRDATSTLTGRQLAGALYSLGQRRDQKAVDLLTGFLENNDSAVSDAAADALGRIATPEAAQALSKAIEAQKSSEPLGQAALVCADTLGDASAAAKVYDKIIGAEMPEHIRLAAMLGRARISSTDAAEWLKQQLTSEDLDHFNFGLLASRELPGDEVAATLTEVLPSLPPARRALVIRALGDRNGELPMALLTAESESPSDDVRAAAIDVLAKSGTSAAVSKLIDLAFGDGEAAPLAQEWLKSVRSEVVDRAIAERAADPKEGARRPLIELIGSRRIVELKPHLKKMLDAAEAENRSAAIASLAQIGDVSDVDLFIERALREDEQAQAAREALRSMALRIDDRDACAKRLASELPEASPENQSYLLRLLREIGGGSGEALGAVVAAAKSTDPHLKDAATRELGAWPTADAADALLALAKNDPQEKYQVRALRGFIRIGRQLQLSDEQRLAFFKAAMETARRDDERVLALDILTRVDSAESIKAATAHLDEAPLKTAAAEAALKIAGRLITSNPEAVARAMDEVQKASVSADVTRRAEELKKRAGGAK